MKKLNIADYFLPLSSNENKSSNKRENIDEAKECSKSPQKKCNIEELCSDSNVDTSLKKDKAKQQSESRKKIGGEEELCSFSVAASKQAGTKAPVKNKMEDLKVESSEEKSFPIPYHKFLEYTNVLDVVDAQIKISRRHTYEQFVNNIGYVQKLARRCYLYFYMLPKSRKKVPLKDLTVSEDCPEELKMHFMDIPEKFRRIKTKKKKTSKDTAIEIQEPSTSQSTMIPTGKEGESEYMKCDICGFSTHSDGEDVVTFGDWMERTSITVHYFCLLLSTNLPQSGQDTSDILGFLTRDIRLEIRNAKARKCCYCDEMGASIACYKCKKYFHLVCGHRYDCCFQFIDDFRSYCDKCVPLDKHQQRWLLDPPQGEHCVICTEFMGIYNPITWIYGRCCGKGFAHRMCMRKYALAAGYYLICLWCLSKDFRNQIRMQGVFVPDRDARWERERNAYAELHRGHEKCNMDICKCPKGRDYIRGTWSIIVCSLCGSFGAHNPGCIPGQEGKKQKVQSFNCETCRLTTEFVANRTASQHEEISENRVPKRDFVFDYCLQMNKVPATPMPTNVPAACFNNTPQFSEDESTSFNSSVLTVRERRCSSMLELQKNKASSSESIKVISPNVTDLRLEGPPEHLEVKQNQSQAAGTVQTEHVICINSTPESNAKSDETILESSDNAQQIYILEDWPEFDDQYNVVSTCKVRIDLNSPRFPGQTIDDICNIEGMDLVTNADKFDHISGGIIKEIDEVIAEVEQRFEKGLTNEEVLEKSRKDFKAANSERETLQQKNEAVVEQGINSSEGINSAPVLKEKTDLEPVVETALDPPATPNDATTDIKMVGTCPTGALNFSLPCQKQLSTILETSEQGTNTKSTISSPDCDALDAKSGTTAHVHLETLKEQTCETTTGMDSVLEPNVDKIAVEQPSLTTEAKRAEATPSAARLEKDGGLNFSIFEDCQDSAVVLPKQVGNFSRLEEHEETTPSYMIQSIKFPEDKTGTVPKIPFTAKSDAKFPEDKTETLSKLFFAPTLQDGEDKMENLVKMSFKPPSLDDTFNFFTQTPPKNSNSQLLSATRELLGFDMEDISVAPKHITNYDDAPQLRDTLTLFKKMNASKREQQATSFKITTSSNKSVMLKQHITKKSLFPFSENNLKTNFKDSFMPDFSVIEETQPQSQALKPAELRKMRKQLSFIKDSQTHHSRATSLKQDSILGQKPPTAPNENFMRDSFNLPDFSMIRDSQPTHKQSGTRWQRIEPSHENILTDSYMKDFSAINEPTPQKAVLNPSTIAKSNNGKSTSFRASENASKDTANISYKTHANADSFLTKPQELVKPLQTSSITTSSVPYKKSIQPNDFFELNAETAQFAPNLSSIKNSTLLPQDAITQQRYTQFQEKSLHIKQEYPFEDSCERSYEMLKSPTVSRKSVPDKTPTVATNLSATYPCGDADDVPAVAEAADENSIYFKETPKTPKIQRHIWNHSSEDELQTDLNFVHRTPDLNHTQQIIDHIHLEDNVNPFDAELINAFLEQIDFTNFIEEDVPTCQLVGKVKQLHKDTIIAVNTAKFKVQKLIGEGAYGAVYCASQMKNCKKYALKQERPPNYWEYYICLEVHSRLAVDELIPAFMSIDYALIGNNASIFISPLSIHGSLITVCNKIKRVTMKNCDEYVVMHITCLLLEIMDHLHAIEIIHADIKTDNFLLMDKLSYGQKLPSIQLIDFGVSIDMRRFKKGQTFSYVHKDNSIKCVEMRENRRWTYQLDLFGLAGVIHVLLFGKYMNVEKNANGFWMHTTYMPRYLNKTLWETIFKSLLNIRDCSSMPNLQNLRVLIKEELAEKESCVLQKIVEFNRVLDC